jgi:hypothetical protein
MLTVPALAGTRANVRPAGFGKHKKTRYNREQRVESVVAESRTMKSLALEQIDQRIEDVLKERSFDEPVVLTKGSESVALLLRLPGEWKDSEIDAAFWFGPPGDRVLVLVEDKTHFRTAPATGNGQPVYGSCRGMLEVASEDEDHLMDFEDYMK